MKFNLRIERYLIILFLLISVSGISQHLKVLEGDSVLTKVAIWEDIESYSSKDNSDFQPKCVLISGDTVLLSDYLSQQFFYPLICRELGYSPNKTFLSVKMKANQQVDSVTILRSFCQNEGPGLVKLFQSISSVLTDEVEFLIVVDVKVIYQVLNLKKPIQPTIIKKNRKRRL